MKKDAYDKKLYDTYTSGAKFPIAKDVKYPEIVPGSKVVPYSVIDDILRRDIGFSEKAINDWLVEKGISIEQHKFDALIMMRHIRGSLGDTITGLVADNASRATWESTPKLGIGDSTRRKAQFDLYFNKTYLS